MLFLAQTHPAWLNISSSEVTATRPPPCLFITPHSKAASSGSSVLLLSCLDCGYAGKPWICCRCSPWAQGHWSAQTVLYKTLHRAIMVVPFGLEIYHSSTNNLPNLLPSGVLLHWRGLVSPYAGNFHRAYKREQPMCHLTPREMH